MYRRIFRKGEKTAAALLISSYTPLLFLFFYFLQEEGRGSRHAYRLVFSKKPKHLDNIQIPDHLSWLASLHTWVIAGGRTHACRLGPILC